jgi:hypothetical protein
MKNKKLLIITSLLALVVLVLGISTMLNHKRSSGTVDIHGITECSVGINKSIVKDINTKMYGFVKSANSYNNTATANSYEATVRKGSCQQLDSTSFTDSKGAKRTTKSTAVIVDIPTAKQSWKITYDWVNNDESLSDIDLGTIKPSCLKTEELIYGDFKCANILSIARYGTDKPDPILQYMPYTGAGFSMEFDPDTKTINVAFDPPSGTTDVPAFIQNTKDIIPYWFQKRGLDQSKYKVIYSSDIDSPDDNQE